MDKRPKRITNKYFNSNGNKEEKQPHTHYPQGNRTSNYYCKSNPQGSQEKQPPQVVPRSSPKAGVFYSAGASLLSNNIIFCHKYRLFSPPQDCGGVFVFFRCRTPRPKNKIYVQNDKFMCKNKICVQFVCILLH